MKNKQSNLYEIYKTEIKPSIQEKFNLKNIMSVPSLEKIVINRGFGKEAVVSKNVVAITVDQFTSITGQKPVLTKSKKAISNFKLRKDLIIGCKVTLRSKKMYDFLTKLINIVLPKIKDFRGVPKKSFDAFGNYTLAIKEDSIFPEVKDPDKIRGLDITFVTSRNCNQEQAFELLNKLGMPFRKN